MTLLAPLEPAVAEVVAEQPEATPAVDLDWPGYGRGAIGLLDDDEVLASYGKEGARPMASITKVIMALMVLEQHPLDGDQSGPTITMGSADVDLHTRYTRQLAQVLPVWPGLAFTEREL